MKKSAILRLEKDDTLSVKVFNEKMVIGENICECCYVKLRNKSKQYENIFNLLIDLKHEENIKSEKGLTEEDEEFLYGDDCNYDIWIHKVLIGKTFYSTEDKESITLTSNDVKTPEELNKKKLNKYYKNLTFKSRTIKPKRIGEWYNDSIDDNIPEVNLGIGKENNSERPKNIPYGIKIITGNSEIDNLLKEGLLSLSDIIENNFNLEKLIHLGKSNKNNVKQNNEKVKVNTDKTNDKKEVNLNEIDKIFCKMFDLPEEGYLRFKKDTVDQALKTTGILEEVEKIKELKTKLEKPYVRKSIFGIPVKDLSRKVPTTHRATTHRNSDNFPTESETKPKSLVLMKTGLGGSIFSCKIDEKELITPINIFEDIYKFDMKFDRNAKKFVDNCKKFLLFNNEKHTFYFTKKFLDYAKIDTRFNDGFDKLKFKKIERKATKSENTKSNENKDLPETHPDKTGFILKNAYIDYDKENKKLVSNNNPTINSRFIISPLNNLSDLVTFFDFLRDEFKISNSKYIFTHTASNYINSLEKFKNLMFMKM